MIGRRLAGSVAALVAAGVAVDVADDGEEEWLLPQPTAIPRRRAQASDRRMGGRSYPPGWRSEAGTTTIVDVRLGGYEIVKEVGRGGMGSVFLGRSPDGRAVAVKLLN